MTPVRSTVTRRALLAGAAALPVAATAAPAQAHSPRPAPSTTVPFTTGTRPPRVRVPHGAVDAHVHVFDPQRFPYPVPTDTPPPRATVDDYRLLRRRLGTTRTVVVTPSNYATDNRATLEAVDRLGQHRARAVAVVDDTFDAAQLRDLDDAGVRGIRFNLTRPGGAGSELIAPLARRVADLGWHVQVHMSADGLVASGALLSDLPVDLVVDHLGRIPGDVGTAHPAFALLRRLLDAGRTWVKLSGLYHESPVGPPSYSDRDAVAAAFVRAAPERLVWGSDWPHPTASRGEVPMPDDAALLDLLARECGDRRTLHRVLVDNPARLYGFAR